MTAVSPPGGQAAASDAAEHAAMLRAVEFAAGALGRTSPNPVVGAVVLDADGVVAGIGRHVAAGQPHAEVTALYEAGERARGGTVVVTLEPCTHTGRTGPCVAALLRADVRRVVIGVHDPDPVAAGGARWLRDAGVDVVVGTAQAAVEWGNRAWLTAVRRTRPYLTWKFAATLDGRSAAADGSSRWITGDAARADVHRLRAECDAVLVGVGTILADDPSLTVRLPNYDGPQPLRVVADSAGRTPPDAKVRQSRQGADGIATPSWIATTADVGDQNGRVSLPALLRELYARDCRSVLLEGGPTLAGAALAAGLVDEVVAYLAPALLGAGTPALGEAGITAISDALRLAIREVSQVGEDIRIVGTPAPRHREL